MYKLLVFVAFIWHGTVSASQTSPISKTAPSPPKIFNEAHDLSANFPPDDRAFILLNIARGIQKSDPSACKNWSLELFRVARDAMSSSNRWAMQKNALVTLSSVDLKLSVQLFKQQDLPASDHQEYEDNRVYAAQPIFSRMWESEGVKSFNTIRDLANWLGATGQYPYSAIGEIISRLKDGGHPLLAEDLFTDATTAYEGAPNGYPDTNYNFANFLLKTYSAATPGMLDKALRCVVDGVETANENGHQKVQIQIENRTGTHAFSSEQDAILYRLLPLLRQADPDLADSVLEKHNALAHDRLAGMGDAGTWHGVVATDDQTTQGDMNAAFERQKLSEVTSLQESNPKRAVELASSIPTPELRDIGLASALPSYIAVSPADGKHILSDIEARLASMPPDSLKLELEVDLVSTYFTLHRDADAEFMARKAFDLGTELISEDQLAHPGEFVYSAQGTQRLWDLSMLLGHRSPQPWSSWQMIQQVHDDVVKAELLVAFGRGLMDRP